VVSGVVYADHEHSTNTILAWHRDVFLEMLLMAVWLFKSFPDVDLWVAFSDEPSRCSLNVPVLQYTVIGLDTVQQAQRNSSAVLQDGSTASITQLLTGGGEPVRIEDSAPKFYRWATRRRLTICCFIARLAGAGHSTTPSPGNSCPTCPVCCSCHFCMQTVKHKSNIAVFDRTACRGWVVNYPFFWQQLSYPPSALS
jgi:hypothetical protein